MTMRTHTKKGKCIVIDGSNGAGKSSVMMKLRDYLPSVGVDAEFTREPGGTPISEKIRSILLSNDSVNISATTELLLFAAARAQHIQQRILPALEAGRTVICDRFDSATFAFQYYGRGLSLDTITKSNEMALNGFVPDRYLLLDVDVKVGIERVHGRGDGLDRMDAQSIDFLERARQGFLELGKQNPSLYKVIDATPSAEEVQREVIKQVMEVIR